MTEPQLLLGKIAALREKLEKAAKTPLSSKDEPQSYQFLVEQEQKLHSRLEFDDEYDSILIHETKSVPNHVLPSQLTVRAKALLLRGRDLIGQLKHFANTFFISELDEESDCKDNDAVIKLYKETAAMADTALRMIPNFPASPASQLQLCSGIEAIFQVIDQRLRILGQSCSEKDMQVRNINTLADILSEIHAGKELPTTSLHAISEQILQEAKAGIPLKILREDPSFPARFVACKGLNLARVAARVFPANSTISDTIIDILSAALICDVGLLGVSEDEIRVLCHTTVKTSRELESHAILGYQMLRESAPDNDLFSEVALCHHENLDGSGYPNGKATKELSEAIRFLAVCERYVARCMANGFDRAINTKQALANTLVDAQDGKLDASYASGLMAISFYPSGSAIELSDGSIGMVLTNTNPGQMEIPSGPVVAIMRDSDGSYLAKPRIVDLTGKTNPAVLRCLTPQEKQDWIDSEFPEWN